MSSSQRGPVLADVARLAGVAPITVSRVVNGQAVVHPDTRARVERAIAELGYRSNMAARTLAGGRSRTLGVIGVETAHYGPARTLLAMEAAARSVGHAVSLATLRGTSADDLRVALDHLRDAHVDGVVVIAPIDAVVRALDSVRSDVPLVDTSRRGTTGASVSIDQAAGARLATAHLLAAGHATVHHIRGPHGWGDAAARVDGWRRELRSASRAAPRPLVGDWTARSGYAIGQRLAGDPSVTAVFVANDQMALGLMLALREAGRRVPADVSVVGFDDNVDAEFYDPPLTTIRQDFGEVGRRSVDLLLGLIAGDSPERVVIAPTLIVRQSTAPSRDHPT